jgi:hypothetical protein
MNPRRRRASSRNMDRAQLALIGLAAGLGLGLLYAWVISPVQYVDTAPNSLRADYQAAYAQLAARAYSVDGDLRRARTRLSLLGMKDPAYGVAALAERAIAGGDQAGARALAALAAALGGQPTAPATKAGAAESPTGGSAEASPAVDDSATIGPGDTPSVTPGPTNSPRPTNTVVPSITPRLLPTRTPTPTPLSAFVFVGQQQVCDPKLDQPLIQVVTENAAGQQIAGVEVVVTWDNGFDHFFTGLKPDLGAGYGDFTMTSGVVYSVHLAESPSVSIDGLTAEPCTGAGAARWPGSILLIFKQPR